VSGSRQREWATDIVESLPSILFLALSQSGVDLKFTGWCSAAAAAIVLVGFRSCRQPFNPIVLGINIHLLIITPLIVGVFHFGAYGLGKTLLAFSHRGVLITVFAVGCALTLLSSRGFVGIAGLPDLKRRAYSLVLLAVSAASVAWRRACGSFVAASTGNPPVLAAGEGSCRRNAERSANWPVTSGVA
jgi:hypothetical protein